jgi:Na+-transporting methylmalonyl-CoA/oxaloacetate decarboxylase gamma subunit
MPDNVFYLNLGLGVVFGFLSLYLLLLVWRFRSAYQQREMIQQLDDE